MNWKFERVFFRFYWGYSVNIEAEVVLGSLEFIKRIVVHETVCGSTKKEEFQLIREYFPGSLIEM